MAVDQPGGDSQRRLEELVAQVAANRADIDALLRRADDANHRADAAEDSADAQRERIEELEAGGKADREAITELADRVRLDQEMIAELQADGLLRQEHLAGLELALRTSRMIGAALGIIMATRRVDETTAFDLLRAMSQRTNRRIRALAEYILLTGDLSGLPVETENRGRSSSRPTSQPGSAGRTGSRSS